MNEAKTPPFEMDTPKASEDVRLKYRYLDLRRAKMQQNIQLRHRAAFTVRRYLDEHGFFEIETPMMIKSTPEGARDYIVPEPAIAGKFLRTASPRRYSSNRSMVSGFDKYFQIVRVLPRRGLARRSSARSSPR